MGSLVAPAALVPSAVSAGLQLACLGDRGDTWQLLCPFSLEEAVGEEDPAFFFAPPPPLGHLTKLLHITGEHLQGAHQQGSSDPSLVQLPEKTGLSEGLGDLCEGGCIQNTHRTPCLCY